MKALLITASLVGAAIAGLILYFRRDGEAAGKLAGGSNAALPEGSEERSMKYTMG